VEAFSFSGDFTMEVSDQTDVTATHQELPVNTCAVRGGAIRFSARRPATLTRGLGYPQGGFRCNASRSWAPLVTSEAA